jgi:hypothetical protein
MQLKCVEESVAWLESRGYFILSVWNAPQNRPPRKPKFLQEFTKYTNKDYLGAWDIGIFAVRGLDRREVRIQVRPQYSHTDREELAQFLLPPIEGYLAVYSSTPHHSDFNTKSFYYVRI